MNWGAIGAVAEVAGVIALLLSVLYLAKQVKIGNDLNRTNTFREIMYGVGTHFNVMFGPDNAELVVKGYASYESLSPIEKLRFDHLLINFFQYAEDSWNSAQVELLGQETLENWSWYLRTQFFPHKGVRDWWAHFKSSYSREFQKWIDTVMQSMESKEA